LMLYFATLMRLVTLLISLTVKAQASKAVLQDVRSFQFVY